MTRTPHARPSAIRRFLHSQAAAGMVLMGAAVVALLIANSPLAPGYDALLHAYLGPLSLGHWINDGLMAVFFLLVGLEIKREILDGQLSSWSRRILPGIAAAGGMIAPALIYLAFNKGPTAAGWAIPAATDIAFALGVIALLGKRVPASLRVFLAALAIIDDLGAVTIIAFFYTAGLSLPDLAGAGGALLVLVVLNRLGVRRLSPYLLVGLVLWVLVLRSGVHATLAGVLLAFTIPMDRTPAQSDRDCISPLHRLEHALHVPVGFFIVPIFGLANAAVPVLGLPPGALVAPVTLGVAAGLLIGKVVGVFGFAAAAIRLGLADSPAHASRPQLLGVALLCGIGFTMSIFITLLAFPASPLLQAEAKIGVLAGSLLSGVLGYAVLYLHKSRSDTGGTTEAPRKLLSECEFEPLPRANAYKITRRNELVGFVWLEGDRWLADQYRISLGDISEETRDAAADRLLSRLRRQALPEKRNIDVSHGGIEDEVEHRSVGR